jgi:hypothetical protein
MSSLLNKVRSACAWAGAKYMLVVAASMGVILGALPSSALAVETEGETKVHEVASQVGSEGITIVLAVLGALVGLIALVIILPKAVKFIKRFI